MNGILILSTLYAKVVYIFVRGPSSLQIETQKIKAQTLKQLKRTKCLERMDVSFEHKVYRLQF